MDSKWYISVLVGVLALASLAAAVTLQLNGSDASHAWEAFGGLVIFFGGVHVPAPTQG